MFWSFVTTSQNTLWHMWFLIRWQKLLLNFCSKATSQSLEHQPSSWVTEGAILESNIISELCELMGIWKVRTLPLYHPTEPMGRWSEPIKMLMQMIGKFGKVQKADWPKHVPELVHAYNSHEISHQQIQQALPDVWAMTAHLPINFYFPTIVSTEKH